MSDWVVQHRPRLKGQVAPFLPNDMVLIGDFEPSAWANDDKQTRF